MKNILAQQTNEVMDHFNFAKVARVMQFLNWHWTRACVLSESDRRRLQMLCKPYQKGGRKWELKWEQSGNSKWEQGAVQVGTTPILKWELFPPSSHPCSHR